MYLRLIHLAGSGAGSARPRGIWRGYRARRGAAAAAAVAGLAAVGLAPAAESATGRPAPHAVSVTAVRGTAATTVPLVTGGQVMVTTTVGGQLSYLLRSLAGGGGAAFWYQAPAGEQYIIPAVALPYAGRELGQSLFDVSALARDGITGGARIPVNLSFAPGAALAAPPGVTLTSASGDSAQGYLTAASGRLLAAALRRQTAADTAHGHLATTGRLFGGLTAMNLAAAGAPSTAHPDYPLHILRFNVTDETGQLANNVFLVLANTDDLTRELAGVPVGNGVGRIAVPAGDYFAFAAFFDGTSKQLTALRGVTVNDFKVPATPGISTVAIDERSAASAISASTPRPATQEVVEAELHRVSSAGPGFTTGLVNDLGLAVSTYVNAQPASKVGRLRYMLRWSGAAPSGAYRYDAAFATPNIPASERFVVRNGQVATIHVRFSADPASGSTAGYWSSDPYDPALRVPGSRSPLPLLGVSFAFPQAMPANLTQYVGTATGDQWVQDDFTPNGTYLIADPRTFADLAIAEDTAVRLGATEVSNSYGAPEQNGMQPFEAAYRHPGAAIVASSGDSGYGIPQFPAVFSSVIAVGGTTLTRAGNARGWTEKAWNRRRGASGSGCSAWIIKPSWQHEPHCPGRMVADIAADADPQTGVAIYDTHDKLGWAIVGGTSVSSPYIAGVIALAAHPARFPSASHLYSHASALNDITSGSNVVFTNCGGDNQCHAVPGYDGPTGNGPPDGLGAF